MRGSAPHPAGGDDLPQTPAILKPLLIRQRIWRGFSNGGAGESFPCWEFDGETLKKKEEV